MLDASSDPRASLRIRRCADAQALAEAAAEDVAARLARAVAANGTARLVAATGAAQIPFLDRLVRRREVEWTKVELFHLDEYVGVPIVHRASFRRFLLDRLITPAGIVRYHFLDGEADPAQVLDEVGRELRRAPIDLAIVGIGENAHLAFNDPPADFETDAPLLCVDLDETCRRQQVGEGWFATLAEVPTRAISMSVRQILASREIVCLVAEARKARAVRAALESPIDPMVPASALRLHRSVTLYLDPPAAALLAPQTIEAAG